MKRVGVSRPFVFRRPPGWARTIHWLVGGGSDSVQVAPSLATLVRALVDAFLSAVKGRDRGCEIFVLGAPNLTRIRDEALGRKLGEICNKLFALP